MKKLTNKGQRRLGVPGRPALILNPNESALITPQQLDEMQKNRTVCRWLDVGVLVLSEPGDKDEPVKPSAVKPRRPSGLKPRPKRDERQVQELPKGLTGEGAEINHLGGGWYEVFVNGFKVTDTNVRKDEANSIASEYE